MTQEELLVSIHNQLVDLKKLLVEIELARPGNGQALQNRLRTVMGSVDHITADGRAAEATLTRQRVIAPTDNNITPGQDAGQA
ncbi:MAG TPA: hypothetical protein VLF67_04920 [Candidatus Saccharimonas sp.]|nr:hypothetical protein [Candidatus Saccharimonas sp.]